MKSINNKVNWRTAWPYLVIIGISILAMVSQWRANAAYVGIDSIFHMNRFYDAMMQIKTGNYSYFQSFFGFGQSGRVVNAVYGPLFAYFNGFLLLVSKSWVNYQLLSSILLFIVSGFLMYRLAIKNNVLQVWAFTIAVAYMFSTPILYWINGQQFTAWGAAFVPLLMLAGTNMMRHHKIAWIQLALSMTLVLEVHNVTSAICALALIPFFITGVVTSDNRNQMWLDLLKSIGLTLLLSFNMWGGMLELFSSNHLLPVFPDLTLQADALHFWSGSTRLQHGVLLIFILVTLYMIIRWRHIDIATKVIILNGLLFLWIPSKYFPWSFLSKLVPAVDSVIQNPIRFLVIPYTLLYLALGMIMSDRNIKWSRYIVTGLAVILVANFVRKDIHHLQIKNAEFNSNAVIISNRLTTVRTTNPKKLRAALRSDNPRTILRLVIKPTPDYLPVKQKISVFDYANFHPYTQYKKLIAEPNIKTNNKVKNGIMTVKWTNNSNHVKAHRLATVKYAHSVVTLNGKRLTNVKTTSIGTMIVKGRPGVNRLTIHYQSASWFKTFLAVSIVGWLGLIGYGIRRLIKRNKR